MVLSDLILREDVSIESSKSAELMHKPFWDLLNALSSEGCASIDHFLVTRLS